MSRIELWTPESGPVERRRNRTDRGGSGGGGTSQLVGWPDPGSYYVGIANGPNPSLHSGHNGIAWGNTLTSNRLATYHDYSEAADDNVHAAKLDAAINAGLVPSQSFKLGRPADGINASAAILAGNYDAQIDAAAQICWNRRPWPIILCYYHEPAGNFTSTTLRSQLRGATRRIVTRFRAAGVDNVIWTQIQEAPFDFRPTPFVQGSGTGAGGSRGFPFRECHPDWNGGTSGTRADWYDDLMMDIFGLDTYTPLVGATNTSFQPYDRIWRDVEYQWGEQGFPIDEYDGCGVYELGMRNNYTAGTNPGQIPGYDPAVGADWVSYVNVIQDMALQYDIRLFTCWDINNTSPDPYYCVNPPRAGSDPSTLKRQGWTDLSAGATNGPVNMP